MLAIREKIRKKQFVVSKVINEISGKTPSKTIKLG